MATTSDTTTTATTAAASETTTATTTDVDTAAAVLADFAGEIASLRSSYEDAAGAASADGNGKLQGPLAASSVLGKLKIIHKAISSLSASPTLKSIQLHSDMAELATMYLPEDTKKVLEDSNCSSEVGLQLVVRDLTQLPSLAKKLFKAREESCVAVARSCRTFSSPSSLCRFSILLYPCAV